MSPISHLWQSVKPAAIPTHIEIYPFYNRAQERDQKKFVFLRVSAVLREISDNGYRVLSFVLCAQYVLRCLVILGNWKVYSHRSMRTILAPIYRSLSKHRYPFFLELALLDLILNGRRISNSKISKFCKIKFTQIYVGSLRFSRPKFFDIFYVCK